MPARPPHPSYPWPRPPRRRSHGWIWVLAAVFGGMVLLGTASQMVAEVSAAVEEWTPTPTPSRSREPDPTPPPEPTPTPTPDPTPTPSPTPEPEPEPEWVHDDWTVPAVGAGPAYVVDSKDQQAYLTDNPHDAQRVPVPVRCDGIRDLPVDSNAAYQARSERFVECLTRAHGPTLEAAGFEAYHPKVVVYGGNAQTACGTLEDWGGWYCGANQAIYLHESMPEWMGHGIAGLDFLLAHEYGHAIQGRNGMWMQAHYLQQRQEGDEQLVLETNRRLEGQADCYAGIGLQALWLALGHEEEDFDWAVESVRALADKPDLYPRTHGAPDTRASWLNTGFQAETYGACNTYSVPSERVR